MADYIGVFSDGTPSGSQAATAQSIANWVQGAQSRLSQGYGLDNSGAWNPNAGAYGIPTGYRVNGNQLVQDSNLWGATWPGLVGMATMGYAGLGAPGLSSMFGGGAGGSG